MRHIHPYLSPPSHEQSLILRTFPDGGDSDSEAVSCSGGRRDDGCWSARFMWRTNGAGELYTYLPPDFDENQAVCDIPPFSTCNDVYGSSVGRGAWTFATGGRTTIAQRVRLNDAGVANGELEVFVGGTSLINVGGLVLRDSDDGRIRGLQMQTFFGGELGSPTCPDPASTKVAGMRASFNRRCLELSDHRARSGSSKLSVHL